MNNKYPTIIKKNNLLVVAKNHLAIVSKLLPSNNDPFIWWNSLSDQWKYIFLWELNITLEEFKQHPRFYLDKLTQCKALNLDFNDIQDISALGNLAQLIWLNLECNKIQDISVLGNLTQLIRLNLEGNGIQDISALGNLTQLTLLYLGFNEIQDISPLTSLINLRFLNLEGNPITQKDIYWLRSKLPNCEIEF